MLDRRSTSRPLDGECYHDGKVGKVRISDLLTGGCVIDNLPLGAQAEDFVRLRIAQSIQVNGYVASRDAMGATIRFYGEIHPFVVSRLGAS